VALQGVQQVALQPVELPEELLAVQQEEQLGVLLVVRLQAVRLEAQVAQLVVRLVELREAQVAQLGEPLLEALQGA